jgi:hypothetical protein
LKYLHLDEGIFCRVRKLAWCNDLESYASGIVAAGRATLAGQDKGEHTDKQRYTGPPGWGLGRWASTPSPGKKTHMLNKPRQSLGTAYVVRPCSENGRRKIAQNGNEVDAETKESTSKTEEKLDGKYEEVHE